MTWDNDLNAENCLGSDLLETPPPGILKTNETTSNPQNTHHCDT